jgi:hypothetical protein
MDAGAFVAGVFVAGALVAAGAPAGACAPVELVACVAISSATETRGSAASIKTASILIKAFLLENGRMGEIPF